MKDKENVCVEENGAEQVAEATTGTTKEVGCPMKEGSATPKKFKDADALARAYGALEAEFTRRSQRIKVLEKELADVRSKTVGLGNSGAEKLKKNAEARRTATREFDKFVRGLESKEDAEVSLNGEANVARTAAESTFDEPDDAVAVEKTEGESSVAARRISSSTDKGEDMAEGVSAREKVATAREREGETVGTALRESVKVASVVGGKAELSSEELYARVNRDEGVRLKIIGEYLASLGKNAPPLTAGGTGAMIAPPLRAKNVADAGRLALQYLKKPFDL